MKSSESWKMRILNSNRMYAEKRKDKLQTLQIRPNLEDLTLSHACHILLIELCAMIDDSEFATDVGDRKVRGIIDVSLRVSQFLHLTFAAQY